MTSITPNLRRLPTGRRSGAGAFVVVGLPVLGLAAALGAWAFAVWVFQVRSFFVPSPAEVTAALAREPRYLVAEGWVTIYETLAGFGFATAAGLLAATVLVSSTVVERTSMLLIIALNAVPKIVLLPLLILWFGYGSSSRIVMASMIAFFPIMVATMAGLRATPAELGELARSLSASRWQAFIKFQVPWSLPQVFVGLKLGMTLSLIGTVVAQLLNPNAGLGAVVMVAKGSANTPFAFAAIVVLTVISIALFYAVVLVERLLLPWARETTAGSRSGPQSLL